MLPKVIKIFCKLFAIFKHHILIIDNSSLNKLNCQKRIGER